MTIEKKHLALKSAHERFHRYVNTCDRDVDTRAPGLKFAAHLLMEFSDVASMALDALADLVPEDFRSETVNLARENLRAMILRPQPERAIPAAVEMAEKEFHGIGPSSPIGELREILLRLYDRASDDQSQREADAGSSVGQYRERTRPGEAGNYRG